MLNNTALGLPRFSMIQGLALVVVPYLPVVVVVDGRRLHQPRSEISA
jgi:hypothetical protein